MGDAFGVQFGWTAFVPGLASLAASSAFWAPLSAMTRARLTFILVYGFHHKDPNPPPDAKGMINIYLTWQPVRDDSSLEGTCSVSRLDFVLDDPVGDRKRH